jgi:hypothetical protein
MPIRPRSLVAHVHDAVDDQVDADVSDHVDVDVIGRSP